MSDGLEEGVIDKSALAASPETLVTMLMLVTTWSGVRAASAPWEMRATEAKAAITRNDMAMSE